MLKKIILIIGGLVTVILLGIFIYTFQNTILSLCFPTVYCDLDFETLVQYIIISLRNLNLDELLVILSNLEYLQDTVEISLNGYDIDVTNPGLFFEMLFQAQNISVETINGVAVNCMLVDNQIYTVHPDLIFYLIQLFVAFEFLFY